MNSTEMIGYAAFVMGGLSLLIGTIQMHQAGKLLDEAKKTLEACFDVQEDINRKLAYVKGRLGQDL